MAQTTGALSGAVAKLEYSLNALGTTGTWVDISGYAAAVEITGGEQITGSQQTMDGDAAIVTGANKTEPFTITYRIVYTDAAATQPFASLWGQFKGTTKTAAVRWSYAGGGATTQQFATTNSAKENPVVCPIVSCTPPNAAADDAGPIMFEFSVITSDILRSTVT